MKNAANGQTATNDTTTTHRGTAGAADPGAAAGETALRRGGELRHPARVAAHELGVRGA